MNFTPGPWRTGNRHPCRIMTQGTIVAYACDPQDEGSEREHEKANARLISAAPELLAMLEGYVRTYPNNTRAFHAIAVIAKARGEV